jgi:hypothetical protein
MLFIKEFSILLRDSPYPFIPFFKTTVFRKPTGYTNIMESAFLRISLLRRRNLWRLTLPEHDEHYLDTGQRTLIGWEVYGWHAR